jgi:hypothetical protein
MTWPSVVGSATALLVLVGSSDADVIEYDDLEEWMAAAGEFETISFTEFQSGTVITDQYAYLGVNFTDGLDVLECCDEQSFPNDGSYLDGIGPITIEFDDPAIAFGVEFPGHVHAALFYGDEMVADLGFLGAFAGPGAFGGAVADEPFDRIVLTNPRFGDVAIDDVHFAFAVPGPPTLVLFVGALSMRAVQSRGRRRREEAAAT